MLLPLCRVDHSGLSGSVDGSIFKCETGMVKRGARMQDVSSRDGQECFSASSELGHKGPRLQSGTSWLAVVLCSGAATERQPLRFPGQRMVLFFGQIFRSERTLTSEW